MFTYWNVLLCLSAVIVTVTRSTVIDSRHLDEHYDCEIVEVSQDKVNLKLFYESLCPGSIQFHTGPLHRLIKEMGTYLDFTAYPYGGARMEKRDGKVVVKCHHGEEECYGNKLHACAIHVLQNGTLSALYNSCMMNGPWSGDGSTDMDATKCGESMKIYSKPIIKCAKSQKGEDLLKLFGKESEKVEFNYVPYVLINGKVLDPDDYNQFKARVCEAFVSPPPSCQS